MLATPASQDWSFMPNDPRIAEEDVVRAEEDFDLCNACGGLCCCLYLATDADGAYDGEGWLPEYIDEWFARFVECGALVPDAEGGYAAGPHGVQPLHDPRLSHRPDSVGDEYRASLPAWVDVRKCQFCHPDTGCLLPRDARAPLCRDYVCELWGTGR